MKAILFIFVIFIACVNCNDDWDNYKQNFSLEFPLKDEVSRFENFMHNLKRLREHNDNSENSWKMAENTFFHMKFEEFSNKFCGTVLPARLRNLAIRKKREIDEISRQQNIRSSTVRQYQMRTTTTRVRPTFFPLPAATTTKKTTTTTTTTTTPKPKPSDYPFGNYDASNAPKEVNYVDFMQKVQNQGGCGSCWSFAAMAQLGEGN